MSQARYIQCLAVESLIAGTMAPIAATGCQLFEGAPGPQGPTIQLYQGGERPAAEVCWELHFGPIPEGCTVGHSCGNVECVDHRHLRLIGEPVATIGEFEI